MYPVTSNSDLRISNLASGNRPTKSLAAVTTTALMVVMFSALLVMAPQRAQAQYGPGEIQVLYSFTGTPDGATPTSGLTFHNGNFYGTTCFGGSSGDATVCNGLNLLPGFGGGTVFELSPNGSGGWNQNIIYSFCSQPNCADGENPEFAGVIFDQNGNMYGTTFNGGAKGYGVVFELSPNGSGGWTESVLYSFKNSPDGANPINGVVMDQAGNLYGTTYAGGSSNGNGTVFKVSRSGSSWTERNLGNINSVGSGLTIDSAGNIYGTTFQGVFKLTPDGQGGYSAKVIFTFNPNKKSQQGSDPAGTLAVDSAGNVYGTTMQGGAHGFGTVYELVKGSTGYTGKVLCSFSQAYGENGIYPFAGVVVDPSGNLYGTTTQGGQFNSDGSIYELVAANNYQEKRILSFNGSDGAYPYASLYLDSQGYLYGTTVYGTNGGSQSDGVVFIVNPHATATSITITSSPDPSHYGETVTFTATVTSPNGPPPDGEVVVFEPIGQAPMTNGVAKFSVSHLPVGKNVIYAVYEGDLNFLYVKSAGRTQQVNQ